MVRVRNRNWVKVSFGFQMSGSRLWAEPVFRHMAFTELTRAHGYRMQQFGKTCCTQNTKSHHCSHVCEKKL